MRSLSKWMLLIRKSLIRLGCCLIFNHQKYSDQSKHPRNWEYHNFFPIITTAKVITWTTTLWMSIPWPFSTERSELAIQKEYRDFRLFSIINRTPMHKLWTSKCSQIKTCLQRDSNSRPLLYESSALPLSYRGCYMGTATKVKFRFFS